MSGATDDKFALATPCSRDLTFTLMIRCPPPRIRRSWVPPTRRFEGFAWGRRHFVNGFGRIVACPLWMLPFDALSIRLLAGQPEKRGLPGRSGRAVFRSSLNVIGLASPSIRSIDPLHPPPPPPAPPPPPPAHLVPTLQSLPSFGLRFSDQGRPPRPCRRRLCEIPANRTELPPTREHIARFGRTPACQVLRASSRTAP